MSGFFKHIYLRTKKISIKTAVKIRVLLVLFYDLHCFNRNDSLSNRKFYKSVKSLEICGTGNQKLLSENILGALN
jgi:hypothetical protein